MSADDFDDLRSYLKRDFLGKIRNKLQGKLSFIGDMQPPLDVVDSAHCDMSINDI